MQDNQKALRPEPEGFVLPIQNGTWSEAGSAADAAAGTSASARLSRRTGFARTLEKIANFAALPILGLPFSRSQSSRRIVHQPGQGRPWGSLSAMDVPRRLERIGSQAFHTSARSNVNLNVCFQPTLPFPNCASF